MSGGHFDYLQEKILYDVLPKLKEIIEENPCEFKKEVMDEIGIGNAIIETAYIYLQRIDWLMSGDDSEDTFLERLREDLEK